MDPPPPPPDLNEYARPGVVRVDFFNLISANYSFINRVCRRKQGPLPYVPVVKARPVLACDHHDNPA